MNSRFLLALTGGFAMFSMFFGSGNLVFPLSVGAESVDLFAYAAAGLFITGVIVPFLGLISMICAEGNRRAFFKEIGRHPAFLLTFLMLAIMGPFGVSARCIIVAFSGVQLVFESLSEALFSFLFCCVTGVLCWQRAHIVSVIGRYLTPLLLGGIFLIILFGYYQAPAFVTSTQLSETLFVKGVNQGYQTMDLLAAFFFSAATIQFLKSQTVLSKIEMNPMKLAVYASLVGMFLLSLVYGGFVYLGAAYSSQLEGVAPAQMLTMIAGLTLGSYALPIMSVTIALACLTTIIILTNLFAEFLSDEVCDGKISRKVSIIITLVISFLVSLAGFTKLASWIGMVLLYAYPSLIALAAGKIIEKVFRIERFKLAPIGFYMTLILSGLYHVLA